VDLIQHLFVVLAVAWLPGAVVFRLPVADRDTRAALPWEERLFWAVIISVAISSGVALGLAVVHRYSFGRLIAADLLVALGAAAVARFRLRLGANAARPGLTAVFPLVLVTLGVLRFFPTSEFVIGGKDPGAYINEGIQIAQRGTIVYRDPIVASVPPFTRDLFFPSHRRSDYYGLRFMGFFVKDPDTGAVVGQFPHLFPASIAIAYGVDGLTGARRAVGFWAMLGVLAVYFAGARVVGRAAAFAAAALLTLHVVQVWFARYPNAEMAMQALLFAALLAHGRAVIDGDDFFAPIAGGLLGLLLFLRFDAVLGVVACLAALALSVLAGVTRPRRRSLSLYFGALALVALLATTYLLGPMRAYADLPIVFLSNLAPWQYGLLAAAGCLAASALIAGSRTTAVGRWVRSTAPTALTIALVAAAVYALYFREPVQGVLAPRDAYALRTFTSFYMTVAGLIAALLGFVLMARRVFWRAPELFVTVAVFSFFFFYKIRIASDHFWMARRFLPVILPGALLFAAAAALGGTRGTWAPTRLLRGAVGVVFVAILGFHYARASAAVRPHVEYRGVITKLEAIAHQIGDRDLLLVESRGASDVHVLAVPLAYIYARNVLVLDSPKPNKEVFASFLEWAWTGYERVLFMGGGGTDLLSPAWSARALASERFTIPEYDAPRDAYPRFVRQKEFDYSVYQLAAPVASASDLPFDLDVGEKDDLHVLRFHAKEQSEGRSFRWSHRRSFVMIAVDATSREIVLSMNDGGRPPSVEPADVAVALDGQLLGTVRVNTGFKPYTLAIPAALAARLSTSNNTVELAISTTVWRPRTTLGTPDDRELGVMVDRVTVK
jgi:hypothetical protein